MNGAMAHSIRTKRFRYTEWRNDTLFEKELYDFNIDPGEHRNLVNDPAYLETLNEMAEMLHNGWKQALPE